MFKNGQLVLLPQHMWAENKGGREACEGRSRVSILKRVEIKRGELKRSSMSYVPLKVKK